MKDPIPKSQTFAEDLAGTLLENFAGVYYVNTEFQREKIIHGAAQLIDYRLNEVAPKNKVESP